MTKLHFLFYYHVISGLCYSVFVFFTNPKLFIYFLIVLISFTLNIIVMLYIYTVSCEIFNFFNIFREKSVKIPYPKFGIFIFFIFFLKQCVYNFYGFNVLNYAWFYFTGVFFVFCVGFVFLVLREFRSYFFEENPLKYEKYFNVTDEDYVDFIFLMFFICIVYLFLFFDERIYAKFGIFLVNDYEPDEKILYEFIKKYVPDYEELLDEISKEDREFRKQNIKTNDSKQAK